MTPTAQFNKKGNIKIGSTVWTFNLLAGPEEIGGCKGSCDPKYCGGCYNYDDPYNSPCYVFKSYKIYGKEKSTVVQSHIRNTNAMREDPTEAFEQLNGQIKRARNKPEAIRIHSSGELMSAEIFRNWLKLAAKWPNIPFYIYTKAYDIVDEVLADTAIPDNFFLNISIWHEFGYTCYNKWSALDNVKAFVVVDGVYIYDFEMETMCPAYKANGRMNHDMPCSKCQICYNKDIKVCGCVEH